MLASSAHSFADPDAFASSVRASKVQLTLTGAGDFEAKIVRIDLHRLWLQRFDDNLPRVAHAANLKGRAIIMFRAGPGPELLRNGRPLELSALRRCADGQESYERSAGRAVRGAMSLPVEDLAEFGAKMAGCDLSPPPLEQIVVPSPVALARLQRLHTAAGFLAEHAPEILASPEAARGLEQALIQSLIHCLAPTDGHADIAGSRRSNQIMKRFRMMIETNPDRVIHLPELCRAVGVSGRLLRACCQEYLGMGPNRYLWLRRMHLAHRALALADPSATSVTEIATAYGFWELGRFSIGYRALFGEKPSAALRRPPALR
jgi:AraC-like DNA-binding protein